MCIRDSPDANLEILKGSVGTYLKMGGDDANNGRALKFTSSTDNTGSNGALHTISATSGNGEIALDTAGTKRLRIDSSGRVLIGTDSSRMTRSQGSGYHGQLQLESNGEAALTMTRFGGTHPSRLNLQHARGTIASIAAAQDDDDLGQISFSGWDGDTFTNAAYIREEVDGAPADDDMPGRLIFSTTPDGDFNPQERLRISSAGYVTNPARPCFDVAKDDGAVSSTNAIVFNVVNVNNGSHYDTSNGRFTAPVTGTYFLYYGGIKNNTSSVVRIKLLKNGTGSYMNADRELRYDDGDSYGENASMNVIVSLTATDYVQVYVTAGTIYGTDASYTHFGGYLLS